jgi:hypothetical protein
LSDSAQTAGFLTSEYSTRSPVWWYVSRYFDARQGPNPADFGNNVGRWKRCGLVGRRHLMNRLYIDHALGAMTVESVRTERFEAKARP